VVTGQCQGHESEPGCVLPNLFGSQGLTLANNPVFPHYAHFIGSAQETLNQTLSSAIATQLAILPLISPSSGFTFQYDKAAGVFVRSTTSFGPIYTERAETIGRGKVSFGASYQRFRFGSIDGINLKNMPAVFTHVPDTGPGGAKEAYEDDVIQTSNSLDLKMDQTTLYGTVGLTDRIDVSVAIPIVDVRFSAISYAHIIQVSGPTFIPAPGVPAVPNPHMFPNGTLSNTYSSNGSATGIGDVTFRLKANVFQIGSFRIAGAVDVRPPTGDAREFLGSGAMGVKPFLILSLSKRISPHVNVGYEWNGESILAGNITGSVVSENSADVAVIANGPATKGQLPGQFFYSLGADAGVTKRLTLDFDYLGQTLFDAPRVAVGSYTTANDSSIGGLPSMSLPTIVGHKNTVGINNGAVGFKYNLFDQLLFTANLLFRMDANGLRQNVTPLVGLSYAFGR
jgi:Putative MetA-pathway of phenol degradation